MQGYPPGVYFVLIFMTPLLIQFCTSDFSRSGPPFGNNYCSSPTNGTLYNLTLPKLRVQNTGGEDEDGDIPVGPVTSSHSVVDGDTLTLRLICTAPYPVKIMTKFEEESQPNINRQDNQIFYQNFYNCSTYNFEWIVVLEFAIANDRSNLSGTILCSRVGYFASQQLLKISVLRSPPTNVTSLDSDSSSEEKSLSTFTLSLHNGTSFGETGAEWDNFEMDSIFHAKQTCDESQKFTIHGYQPLSRPWSKNMFCTFSNGTVGRTHGIQCKGIGGCLQQFGQWLKKQASSCIQVFMPFLTTNEDRSFQPPFLVMCTPDTNATTVVNQTRPSVYAWSINAGGIRADPQDSIFMSEFSRVQILGSVIKVKCTGSQYVNAQTMQFALLYEGEETLRFLAPSMKIRMVNSFHETREILVDPKLRRVYCFSPLQNGYDWANTSRTVMGVANTDFFHEQECPSFTNQKKMGTKMCDDASHRLLRLPRIELWNSRGTPLTSFALSGNVTSWISDGTNAPEIACVALVPSEIIYDTTMIVEEPEITRYRRMFEWKTNFFNYSTQGFLIRQVLNFRQVQGNSTTIRCQVIESPCDSNSIRYSLETIDGNQREVYQLPSPTGGCTNLHPAAQESLSAEDKGLSKQGVHNSRQFCEAIFYYEQKHGYTFRCNDPLSTAPGLVQVHHCKRTTDCNNLFRYMRQPTNCWQPFVPGLTCNGCPPKNPTTLQPFVLTCQWYEGGSSTGSFAFFGIPTTNQSTPQIHFSLENVVAGESFISMDEFYPFQLVNASLSVTCTISLFYFQSPVYFGLHYAEKNDTVDMLFEVIDVSPNMQLHLATVTKTILLDNDRTDRVFCFVGSMDRLEWTNTSRSVHVAESQTSKISIDLEQLEEDHTTLSVVTVAPDGRLSLPMDSENCSIVCHVFAYPPPEILWTSTSRSQMTVEEIQVSPTHRVSRVKLAKVHQGLTGTYICTAKGYYQSTSENIKLDVIEPIDYGRIFTIIGLVGGPMLLGSGSLLLVLRRRNRLLKERLRNLTPEEIREVVEGYPEMATCDALQGVEKAMAQPLTRLIAEGQLTVVQGSILGKGQFGIVYRGFLGGTAVAVKTVQKSVDTRFFKEFLGEVKIMSYLGSHKHVIQYLGVDMTKIDQRIVYCAVELSPIGSLENFLKKHGADTNTSMMAPCHRSTNNMNNETETQGCSMRDLISWCEQIGRGMEFLESRKVIHADLASRNVLMFENNVVKITDFGLSRHLYKYARYNKKNCKDLPLPLSWMAVESLTKGEFSHKSDVWSFGVTVWEIFSLGQEPFPNSSWDPQFVGQLLSGELRLLKPYFASDIIYDEMVKCWHVIPEMRPTFGQLAVFFEQVLSQPLAWFPAQHLEEDNVEMTKTGQPDSTKGYVTMEQAKKVVHYAVLPEVTVNLVE